MVTREAGLIDVGISKTVVSGKKERGAQGEGVPRSSQKQGPGGSRWTGRKTDKEKGNKAKKEGHKSGYSEKYPGNAGLKGVGGAGQRAPLVRSKRKRGSTKLRRTSEHMALEASKAGIASNGCGRGGQGMIVEAESSYKHENEHR